MKSWLMIISGLLLSILNTVPAYYYKGTVILNNIQIKAGNQDKSYKIIDGEKNNQYKKTIKEETVYVKTNMIIYFTISQEEYAAYDTERKNGVDDVLSDFYANIGYADETLKNNGIKSIITISKILTFRYPNGKTEKLVIDNTYHIIGMILVGKNKKPEIYYGIFFNDQIYKKASEYFNIKIKYPYSRVPESR